ncbi:MAG: response regulator [Actinomycetota bacterium]
MAGPAHEASKTTILVVDDEEAIARSLVRLLERSGYKCFSAGSAEEARGLLGAYSFDLLLTDMDLPGESGLELINTALRRDPNVATVMVTGFDDPTLATSALDMGAYGYIIKPFEPNEILIGITNALRRRGLEIDNRNHRDRLEATVRERTAELWNAISSLERTQEELRTSREETIRRLSVAAEFRDDETARHIQRMSLCCELLGQRIGIDVERCELIRVASQMHDVGKIGIPDSILLKPGPLTPEERAIMERHAEIGHRILAGSSSDLLQLAATIAWTHHEKIDGTGYPRGLKGDEIPLEGRIAAICDVFDALTSNRIYKRAFPVGKAIDTMREAEGSHFDPEMLDVFFDAMDVVLTIKTQHPDR